MPGRTKLVAATHVSNILGTVTDVGAVAKAARAVGARVVVDGVAYVAHHAPDVAALGVDWYVYSCYKVYGPHMAALYGEWGALEALRDASPNHAFVDPTSAGAPRWELGTVNHEGAAAVAALGDYLKTIAAGGAADEAGGVGEGTSGAIEVSGVVGGRCECGPEGKANGKVNGQANGKANGQANGKAVAEVAVAAVDRLGAGVNGANGAEDDAAAACACSRPLDRPTVLRAYARMAAAEEAPATKLLDYLASRPDARVLGLPTTAGRVPTISVVHAKLSSRYVYERALESRVICRHGAFLAPRLLNALGVEDAEDGALRFSLVHYNTVADVDKLIAVLEGVGF